MTKQIVYNINYNFILLRVGKILKKKTEFNYYCVYSDDGLSMFDHVI